MIVGPMSRLRISFESQDLVQRIIRETSGMPNYVQFYCQSLIEILDDENRREIKLSDVENIYEQAEFRNFVIDNFVSNSEPVEQALVYCLISEYQGAGYAAQFYPESDGWAVAQAQNAAALSGSRSGVCQPRSCRHF